MRFIFNFQTALIASLLLGLALGGCGSKAEPEPELIPGEDLALVQDPVFRAALADSMAQKPPRGVEPWEPSKEPEWSPFPGKADLLPSLAAVSQFCDRPGNLAFMTRDGCRAALSRLAQYYERQLQYETMDDCLDFLQTQRTGRNGIVREHRAWCEQTFLNVHDRTGCYDAVPVFLGSLTERGFCRNVPPAASVPPGSEPPYIPGYSEPGQKFDTPKRGRDAGSAASGAPASGKASPAASGKTAGAPAGSPDRPAGVKGEAAGSGAVSGSVSGSIASGAPASGSNAQSIATGGRVVLPTGQTPPATATPQGGAGVVVPAGRLYDGTSSSPSAGASTPQSGSGAVTGAQAAPETGAAPVGGTPQANGAEGSQAPAGTPAQPGASANAQDARNPGPPEAPPSLEPESPGVPAWPAANTPVAPASAADPATGGVAVPTAIPDALRATAGGQLESAGQLPPPPPDPSTALMIPSPTADMPPLPAPVIGTSEEVQPLPPVPPIGRVAPDLMPGVPRDTAILDATLPAANTAPVTPPPQGNPIQVDAFGEIIPNMTPPPMFDPLAEQPQALPVGGAPAGQSF